MNNFYKIPKNILIDHLLLFETIEDCEIMGSEIRSQNNRIGLILSWETEGNSETRYNLDVVKQILSKNAIFSVKSTDIIFQIKKVHDCGNFFDYWHVIADDKVGWIVLPTWLKLERVKENVL